MTIDEAIEKAKDVSKRNREQWKNCPADRRDIEHQTCEQCAEEYEQLAVWLEELKDYRNKNKMVVRVDVENVDSIKDKIDELSKYAESQYIKAIDDLSNTLKENYDYLPQIFSKEEFVRYIDEYAEQLKAGEQSENHNKKES